MNTATHPPAYSVGELLAAADWACAHGDVETVGYIARQLAEQFSGHLHDELLSISRSYPLGDAKAAKSWTDLRVRLHEKLCTERTRH
jgi:hypothetical protein